MYCACWVFLVFFHLLPKQCPYFYVRVIDSTAGIFFPNSYAATGNQTHVSSVASLLRDLNPGYLTSWANAAAACSQSWQRPKPHFKLAVPSRPAICSAVLRNQKHSTDLLQTSVVIMTSMVYTLFCEFENLLLALLEKIFRPKHSPNNWSIIKYHLRSKTFGA